MYKIYEKLRDEKGVTNYQVCKETGLNNSDLSNWKRGKYQIKIDKLQKLADYFGVKLSVLIGEEE